MLRLFCDLCGFLVGYFALLAVFRLVVFGVVYLLLIVLLYCVLGYVGFASGCLLDIMWFIVWVLICFSGYLVLACGFNCFVCLGFVGFCFSLLRLLCFDLILLCC